MTESSDQRETPEVSLRSMASGVMVVRMKCDEVRLELALWVGNDLDDPARIEELRRHISTCPDCRWREKSLQSSMILLGATAPDPTFDCPESLWPELNARIDYLEKAPPTPPPYGKWSISVACGLAVCGGTWAWMNRSLAPSPPPVHTSTPSTGTPQNPVYSPGLGPVPNVP